jgi:hypothetical protein
MLLGILSESQMTKLAKALGAIPKRSLALRVT